MQTKQYLAWLIDNNLTYHPDDSPNDIVWQSEPSPAQIDTMNIEHTAMWERGGPWELLEADIELYEAYSGQSIE